MRRARAASATLARAVAKTGLKSKVHADDGPDAVVCLLCRKSYRAIRVLHLRRWHDFEGEHPVEDYKRRFGLTVAVCRSTRRALRRSREDYWAVHGQRWPRERVLGELRRRAKSGQAATSRLGVPLSLAVRRRFGTWERAMRRAGLDPDANRAVPRWGEDRLDAGIRARSGAGRALAASIVARDDPALYRAAIRCRGNWSKALRSVGLDPREHRLHSKWGGERARDWVLKRRASGLPITAAHVPAGLHGHVCGVTKGGWSAFVESLGISYPGVHKERWTDAMVIERIRQRRRKGLALNQKAVQRDVQALVHQGSKRFGSWDGALLAAGIDPLGVRLSRRRPDAEIVAAIRARHAARRPLERALMRADDPRLVKAAEHRYGSWGRAIAAAGLPRWLAKRGGGAA